jgi:hypothetical protein
VVGAGVGYLGSIARSLEWWEAAGVIAKLFLAPEVSQSAVLGATEIARAFAAIETDIALFVSAVNQIVSAAWNRRVVPAQDLLLGAGCVGLIHPLFTKKRIADADLLWDIAFLNAWGRTDHRGSIVRLDVDLWSTEVKDIADQALLDRLQTLEPAV